MSLRMKSDLRFCMVCILCLAVLNVALAERSNTARRNRTSKRLKSKGMSSTTRSSYDNTSRILAATQAGTEIPAYFPYAMVCISKKLERAVALKTTEQCCHLVGVPCKQTDHIGQPHERSCVTENPDEWNNMKACCKKKKKTFKRGHVEDGIDCSHRRENDTETTEMPPLTPEPTTSTRTTLKPTTTTTHPTTVKPHPKTTTHHPQPTYHHPKTSRPQHQISRPHVDHPKHTTPHSTTTTTTTTTTTAPTTTKKPRKPGRKLDKVVKTLKFD